jgi:hypothetical protein
VSPEQTGSALTILTRIARGHKAELCEFLTRTGTSIDSTTEIELGRLRTVHFMRWVVIDDLEDASQGTLVFESNHDGTIDQHLDDLYACGSRFMHEVYRRCEGYPVASAKLERPEQFAATKAFLKGHTLPSAAFYVGIRGKSTQRIRDEAALRDAIQDFVDARYASAGAELDDLEAVYEAILGHLKEQRPAELARVSAHQAARPRRRILPLALRGTALLAALLPVALPAFLLLRYKELTDPEESYDAFPEATAGLAEREDFQVQNQLTHLVAVKPGLLRQLTLRLVLYVSNTLTTYYFNQGDLLGLSTIHYARWVLLDRGKRVLFFSNFDGSWERYLGDFVDQVHAGLTSVWSNTEGFPKTCFLLGRGATDEERFKAWTRAHQIPTQLWYSAYPSLTVPNISRNGLICEGLVNRPRTREALSRWLELL